MKLIRNGKAIRNIIEGLNDKKLSLGLGGKTAGLKNLDLLIFALVW